MHWVQAIIATDDIIGEAKRLFSSFVICPLSHGLALVPITDQAEQELRNSEFATADPMPPLAEEIVPGVSSLAAMLSDRGPVVYAATFFHGGTGGQDALVWKNGELVQKIHDDEDNPSQWPNSPISRALRYIGVKAENGKDKFDAIGLGNHRSNEAWAKAYEKA